MSNFCFEKLDDMSINIFRGVSPKRMLVTGFWKDENIRYGVFLRFSRLWVFKIGKAANVVPFLKISLTAPPALYRYERCKTITKFISSRCSLFFHTSPALSTFHFSILFTLYYQTFCSFYFALLNYCFFIFFHRLLFFIFYFYIVYLFNYVYHTVSG